MADQLATSDIRTSPRPVVMLCHCLIIFVLFGVLGVFGIKATDEKEKCTGIAKVSTTPVQIVDRQRVAGDLCFC